MSITEGNRTDRSTLNYIRSCAVQGLNNRTARGGVDPHHKVDHFRKGEVSLYVKAPPSNLLHPEKSGKTGWGQGECAFHLA